MPLFLRADVNNTQLPCERSNTSMNGACGPRRFQRVPCEIVRHVHTYKPRLLPLKGVEVLVSLYYGTCLLPTYTLQSAKRKINIPVIIIIKVNPQLLISSNDCLDQRPPRWLNAGRGLHTFSRYRKPFSACKFPHDVIHCYYALLLNSTYVLRNQNRYTQPQEFEQFELKTNRSLTGLQSLLITNQNTGN